MVSFSRCGGGRVKVGGGWTHLEEAARGAGRAQLAREREAVRAVRLSMVVVVAVRSGGEEEEQERARRAAGDHAARLRPSPRENRWRSFGRCLLCMRASLSRRASSTVRTSRGRGASPGRPHLRAAVASSAPADAGFRLPAQARRIPQAQGRWRRSRPVVRPFPQPSLFAPFSLVPASLPSLARPRPAAPADPVLPPHDTGRRRRRSRARARRRATRTARRRPRRVGARRSAARARPSAAAAAARASPPRARPRHSVASRRSSASGCVLPLLSLSRAPPPRPRLTTCSAQQLLEKAAKAAVKSHKERVAEFNEKLENLSEHYDIPKVRPRPRPSSPSSLSSCALADPLSRSHRSVPAERPSVPLVRRVVVCNAFVPRLVERALRPSRRSRARSHVCRSPSLSSLVSQPVQSLCCSL